MKLKNLSLPTIILLFSICCSPNKHADNKSYDLNNSDVVLLDNSKKYFDNCDVKGSIAIYDIKEQKWITSDTIGIKVETLPASTFKIINLLIALETKTISDENEIIKWVGRTDTVNYGYRPEIYHDMSVKEAFETSAGWVFVELAKNSEKINTKNTLQNVIYSLSMQIRPFIDDESEIG
ncbi:beta-lactamase class D [Algoriphagus sp. 4150]|nr:penicillin-binding transpeptidase domain-containing protein [Algoriphagus sp. 4150]MDR7128140.1 beta-lactamase class D [Algoriphagus sp. 4150]